MMKENNNLTVLDAVIKIFETLEGSKLSEESLNKISRELHDGVAQDLAALKIYLNKSDKEKSYFYADQALKEVRYLIDSMHLDLSKSFASIVRENLENFETNFGIKSKVYEWLG